MSFYCKTLPVHYSSKEEFRKRKTAITFNVSIESPGNSALSKQVVCQLTKDDEPLFLYILRFAEEDFHALKTQQNLLIDFANFPQKFVDLLESVLSEDSKTEPKFLLYFIENSSDANCGLTNSFLEIVESNLFKHLVHLSLKFVRADDKQLQKYLSDSIMTLKKREQQIVKQSRAAENELTRKYQEKDNALLKQSQDFDIFKTQQNSSTKQIREDFEKERRSMEEQIREFQLEIQRLKLENQQIPQLKDDLKLSKITENQLQRELIECEKIRNQLQTQLQTDEQCLDEKDVELQRQEDKYQALLEQKRKLEEISQQRYHLAKQMEHKFKEQYNETSKGVQIISKFQSELAQWKTKAQTRAMIAIEQEKLIKTKQSSLETLTKEFDSLAQDVLELKDQNKKLSEKLETVEKEDIELKKQNETKTSLINFLNKQLGENHLKPISSPPAPYGTSKSSSSLNYKPVLGISSFQNNENVYNRPDQKHFEPNTH